MSDFTWVGKGGQVARGRIVAVGRWDSSPVRRFARKARADNRLIDLTYGQACHWVYFLDSGHVLLGTENPLSDEMIGGRCDEPDS
jgi:regulator of extracellular matrix RemA (YlzA/DUF370 family)